MVETDEKGPRTFFYGSSENRLNTKGQVAIPKRFRGVLNEAQLAEGFVVLRGEGDCLYMYTHRQFADVMSRVRQVARETGDSEFYRRFLEGAHAVDLDSQGRFVLPAGLRKDVGIEGPGVLFVGMDDRIEIWEPARRAAVREAEAEYEERRAAQAKRIFGM